MLRWTDYLDAAAYSIGVTAFALLISVILVGGPIVLLVWMFS